MKGFIFSAVLLLSQTLCSEIQQIQDQNTLTIKTPSFRERKTAKVQLSNGLKALVISDPNIEQSAASVAVEVGSWSDPKKYPGAAHFTEHLLFLGTEEYPEEDAFMKYVQEHGGMINAYTSSDRTVYIFSINNESFVPALDQFAHMFIDPLFNENGIERELHAVDQENDKNIENDARREYQVLKELANPDHPFSMFSTGNAETLGNIPRKEVMKWHDEFYGANNAHLVVYSNQPLDKLLQCVDEKFSKIPSGSTIGYHPSVQLFDEKYLGSMVYIKPIKDLKELNVYWELPVEYVRDTDFKTASLLGYVLSSKGPSSLYAQLRAEGLIEDMGAGPASLSKDTGVFATYFKLTEMGTKHTNDILERLYQTLASIKQSNIPPYIFNELRTMQKINYEFQSKTDAYSYVSSAVSEIIDESLETYPMKTLVPTVYDPKRVQFLISYLKPDRALYVSLMDPQFSKVSPDVKEKWHNVEYAIKPISSMQLRAWGVARTHPNIAIQKPNPYLPKQLQLVSLLEDAPTTPILLYSERVGKLYFAQDETYFTPTIAWNIGIRSPELKPSATASVLTDLYLMSVDEKKLATEFYARSAGLSSSVSKGSFTLNVSISGYSDKALSLLRSTLQTMKHIETTERDFVLYKESLLSEYENQTKDLPFFYARSNVSSITSNDSYTPKEHLEALRSLTYKEYKEFETKLLETVYFEAVAIGNMTPEDGSKVWKMLTKEMGGKTYFKEDHIQKKFIALPNVGGPYKIMDQNQMQGNVAILLLQAGPFSHNTWASHALLGKMLNPDFFETLRTKQQTGYITKGMTGYVDSELIQFFGVQSTTHQPEELIARFELFLEERVKSFDTLLSEERFEKNKASLIESLETPATNINELCGRYVEYGFTHGGDFDFRKKQIEAVKKLDYVQFKKDSIATIGRNNGKRLAYMLQGAPLEGKEFKYLLTDAEELKNSCSYVSWK